MRPQQPGLNGMPGISVDNSSTGGNPLMGGSVSVQSRLPSLQQASNPFNNSSYALNAFLGGMPNANQILDQRYNQFYGPQGFQGPWTANG